MGCFSFIVLVSAMIIILMMPTPISGLKCYKCLPPVDVVLGHGNYDGKGLIDANVGLYKNETNPEPLQNRWIWMNDTNVFDQLPNCTRGHSDYELEECDEGRILDIEQGLIELFTNYDAKKIRYFLSLKYYLLTPEGGPNILKSKENCTFEKNCTFCPNIVKGNGINNTATDEFPYCMVLLVETGKNEAFVGRCLRDDADFNLCSGFYSMIINRQGLYFSNCPRLIDCSAQPEKITGLWNSFWYTVEVIPEIIVIMAATGLTLALVSRFISVNLFVI